MDRDEILKMRGKGENSKLELKERFSESVLKTISGFANTHGGLIIVGVNDKK